jgi:hypothetical protein
MSLSTVFAPRSRPSGLFSVRPAADQQVQQVDDIVIHNFTTLAFQNTRGAAVCGIIIGSGVGIRPSSTRTMVSRQISAGRPPPVTPLNGVLLS